LMSQWVNTVSKLSEIYYLRLSLHNFVLVWWRLFFLTLHFFTLNLHSKIYLS
jgi:hypothetical protein